MVKQTFFNIPENLDELKNTLQTEGVVQLTEFIRPDILKQMDAELQELPWDMAYVVQGKTTKHAVKDVMALPTHEQNRLFATIAQEAAHNQYAFCYDSYMLITHYLKQTRPNSVFHQYVEQLCHPQTVAFMQQLTGNLGIIKADGQISRYLPGHFLKSHDDNGAPVGQVRAAAYTIGLSKNWQPDWGGVLHLQNADFSIKQSLSPSYNTLTVFSVPQFHFVSQVANYCPAARYSIVGWFRADTQ